MTPARLRRRTRRAGHTLLEISIGLGAFSALMLGTMRATLSAKDALQDTTSRNAMSSRAQRALDAVVGELAIAGASTVTPTPQKPFGASSFAFQEPTGISGTTIAWSTARRVELAPTKVDPKNGRDDDGDGWIDETSLALVVNVGKGNQRSVVLASDVCPLLAGEKQNGKDDNGNGLIDEAGFSAVLDGRRLILRLSLAGVDAFGHSTVETATTSVTLRN